MRLVHRRVTKPWYPKAPWEYRGVWREGAPRVLRSPWSYPVIVDGVEVGLLDVIQHLYSHHGATDHSAHVKIDSEWFVVYELETEWRAVQSKAYWIEYVNDSQEAVARISRIDARRQGHRTTHGGREVWAVPFKHYEVLRRADA